MKQLKRDVHLVLTPKAARILDSSIARSLETYNLLDKDTKKILQDVRKQIREFATEPR